MLEYLCEANHTDLRVCEASCWYAEMVQYIVSLHYLLYDWKYHISKTH